MTPFAWIGFIVSLSIIPYQKSFPKTCSRSNYKFKSFNSGIRTCNLLESSLLKSKYTEPSSNKIIYQNYFSQSILLLYLFSIYHRPRRNHATKSCVMLNWPTDSNNSKFWLLILRFDKVFYALRKTFIFLTGINYQITNFFI